MGKQIGKDFDDGAKKAFHDMREKGAPDRTLEQLKQDGRSFYEGTDKKLRGMFKQ